MSRGEVWWVDFEPSRGSEASKRRPAIIVGRDRLVRQSLQNRDGTVTVVPVTSNVQSVYDFHVFLPAGTGGLDRDSKAQAEQIRTVSVTRLAGRVGRVSERVSVDLDRAIRLYLGL